MTKGELFKYQFDVEPCAGGSFIVRVPSAAGGRYETYAFTRIADLLAWFQSHAQALPAQQSQQPQPGLKDRLLAKHSAPKDSKQGAILLPDLTKQARGNGVRRMLGLS